MMKRTLTPHDFTLLRDLALQASSTDKYTKYVFGGLIAWDYAIWDERESLVSITEAGRQALYNLDMKIARDKARKTVQASIWDAEFAAEYVNELEGMAAKSPAARPHLEAAQLAAEQAARHADAAQAALENDDFVAVQTCSQASSRACQEARQALSDAARMVMKGGTKEDLL